MGLHCCTSLRPICAKAVSSAEESNVFVRIRRLYDNRFSS